MLVLGEVLIKPLSCCWKRKLYNQLINNSPFFGRGERRKGGGGALKCRKFPTKHGMEEQAPA